MIILKRNFAARGIVITEMHEDENEQVTTDLCIGDRYQIAGKSKWYELRGQYALRPGTCVTVKTHERITLPQDVFGVLCSKGSLSARGLIVSNTKVDPLFGDHLNIPVFNSGRATIRISPGMAFCSICFHMTEQRIAPQVYRKAITQEVPRRRIVDVIAAHSAAIISGGIGGIATILIGLLTLYLTLRAQPNPENPNTRPLQQRGATTPTATATPAQPNSGNASKSVSPSNVTNSSPSPPQ
jgi:deoxycytidine triphosphate deaminase